MTWVDYLMTFLFSFSVCAFIVSLYFTSCALTQFILKEEDKGYIKVACRFFLFSLVSFVISISF